MGKPRWGIRSPGAVPLDELHGQEVQTRALLDRMNGDDVRMVERRDDACLAFEALAPLRIVGKRRRQDLDRDFASKPGIARAIDLAHAAFTEVRENFVRAELAACVKRHVERLEIEPEL